MKNIKEYTSAGEWYLDKRKEGYSIPGAMCHGITVAQKELGMSFSEVFDLFVKNGIILEFNHFYIYNMMGHLKLPLKV